MIKRLDSKYEKKVIDYLNIEKEINTFNLQELKNYGFDNVFYKVYSDIDEDGNANVKLMVMSSSVKMIDNRSYIYKIQIMAYVTVEKLEDVEAVTGADRENMMTKYSHIDGISIVADKSDNLRIHEQLSVPSSKPPIERILWKDVRIKNINEKMK